MLLALPHAMDLLFICMYLFVQKFSPLNFVTKITNKKNLSRNISVKIIKNIKNGVWINMRDENVCIWEGCCYVWLKHFILQNLPRHKFLLKGLTNYDLEGYFSFSVQFMFYFFYDLRGCLSFIHNSVNNSITRCHRAFVWWNINVCWRWAQGNLQ